MFPLEPGQARRLQFMENDLRMYVYSLYVYTPFWQTTLLHSHPKETKTPEKASLTDYMQMTFSTIVRASRTRRRQQLGRSLHTNAPPLGPNTRSRIDVRLLVLLCMQCKCTLLGMKFSDLTHEIKEYVWIMHTCQMTNIVQPNPVRRIDHKTKSVSSQN